MNALLVGTLDSDVKLSYTKNGILVGKFYVLFKDSNKQHFISCLAFNGFAKRLSEANRGQSLDLIGDYQTSTKSALHTYFVAKTVVASAIKKETLL